MTNSPSKVDDASTRLQDYPVTNASMDLAILTGLSIALMIVVIFISYKY